MRVTLQEDIGVGPVGLMTERLWEECVFTDDFLRIELE